MKDGYGLSEMKLSPGGDRGGELPPRRTCKRRWVLIMQRVFGRATKPNCAGTGSAWLCDPCSCQKEGEYCFIAEMLIILKYDVWSPPSLDSTGLF